MASFSTNSEGKDGKGLWRKLIDFMASLEGFPCGFAPGAGASLFFIADKELQAATVKKTGEDGRAGLSSRYHSESKKLNSGRCLETQRPHAIHRSRI